MKLNITNLEDLSKKGIYCIKFLKNNKVYIGSTNKCFKNRFIQHKSKLKTNTHNNPILQNYWNKYGEDFFEFSIIEVLEKDILKKEEFYIAEFNACNFKYGFNINPIPSESCSNQEIVKKKISKTLTEKYKNNELLPTKGCFKKGGIPWNKGIKYEDTSKMKVPKSITTELKQAWKNTSLRARQNSLIIEIYNINDEFLYAFRSIPDLMEWQLLNVDKMSLLLSDYPSKLLEYTKVIKALKSGKPYKKLYFKRVKESLHKVICVEKSDEFKES